MPEVTIVNVRDVSSGRIHRRFAIAGTKELASFESDNADDAGEVVVIHADELGKARNDDFCKRCFPERA
jgi:hypothetical protein